MKTKASAVPLGAAVPSPCKKLQHGLFAAFLFLLGSFDLLFQL
jgi:hypothetical protein